MKTTKFIVKVDRGGTQCPEYVQRVDRTPVKMTFNHKLALVMGKFAARGCRQIHPKLPRHPRIGAVDVHALETILGSLTSSTISGTEHVPL